MYKLTPFNKKGQDNLTEIFQSLELKMSFARVAGDSVDRIHRWVKCRDFLGDIIWATNTNKKKSIYGLTYDPAEDLPIEKDSLTLLLKFPNKNMQEVFINNLTILNTVENDNKQPNSTVYSTDDSNVLLLKASPFWQQNIPVLSFYTFILKVMCAKYEHPENWVQELPKLYKDSPEDRYIRTLGTNLDIMLKHCYNIFKDDYNIHGYRENQIIDVVHNCSGFVTVCQQKLPYYTNAHHEKFHNYVQNMGKTTKRAPRKSAKVVEALNAAAPAYC